MSQRSCPPGGQKRPGCLAFERCPRLAPSRPLPLPLALASCSCVLVSPCWARVYTRRGDRRVGGARLRCPTRRRRMSSSRAPLCAIAVGSLGVVNVRAMCVSDRHAIEGVPRDGRVGAVEGPLTWRAGP
eukprot:4932083-Prymnesium_polylepis.1